MFRVKKNLNELDMWQERALWLKVCQNEETSYRFLFIV